MKKVLFATTAMMLTGGMALADVTISGNGRFGLLYQETPSDTDTETSVSYRLRFNIDASKETDSGVTFGGRIRLQYDNGDEDSTASPLLNEAGDYITGPDGAPIYTRTGQAGAELNAAKIYASYQGMTVEVGNVDTAYDSAALMYNSEIGFLDRSYGDPQGAYYSYSSSPYDYSEKDRMGIGFTYSVGEFNGRISWVTPNQYGDTLNLDCGEFDATDPTICTDPTFNTFVSDDREDEFGISGDYTFGAFTVSAAAVQNGAGIDKNDNYFLGGEYAIGDVGAVGLQYFDNGDLNGDDEGDLGHQFTLYGNYKFNDIIVKGYIANNDADYIDDLENGQDTVYGIGADYDLGGATLSGSVQQGYTGDTTADIGVRFSF